MASVRATAIGSFVDTVTALSAATSNDGAGGIIGYDEIMSNSAGTTTIELVSTIANVPVNAGRLIKITASGILRATGAMGLQVLIQEDGVDLNRQDHYVHASGTDAPFNVPAFSHAPSAGNHTYTLHTGISGAGGFTVTLTASSSKKTLFIVEDAGPDF